MKRLYPAVGGLLLTALSLFSCEEYLAKKPDEKLAIPNTVEDLQLLLDNYNNMNNQYPYASAVMSDNFYMLSKDYNSIWSEYDRNLYIWQKDDSPSGLWGSSYKAIYTANIVLDGLKDLKPSSTVDRAGWENAKGNALFFRGFYFYALSQLFAPPYNKSSAESDHGLPLRLSADFSTVSVRASVQQTYERIIRDFKVAARLLPVKPLAKSRPSRPAAFGALARTYLAMGDYGKAGLYADSCLMLYDNLIDYNTLDTSADFPFKAFHKEIVFQALCYSIGALSPSRAKVDSTLYNSYADGDLRKWICFKDNSDGSHTFKGDYGGVGYNGYVFGGIATDGMYLIRAECLARSGEVELAMQYLNHLLEKRWKSGTYTKRTAATADDALALVLGERRKELLFRGTRWTDLRRLKDDPRYMVSPKRMVNGETYELPPESPRYTLQIPERVIEFTGMPQNP